MKFPAGTDGGTIGSPRDEGTLRQLASFAGVIEVRTGSGNGLILAEHGVLLAAYFRSDEGIFRGKAALVPMQLDNRDATGRSFRLRMYTPGEFAQAVRIAKDENLFLAAGASTPRQETPRSLSASTPSRNDTGLSPPEPGPRLLDEDRLMKIQNQPGVIAVSAFYEGFPVQSVGNGDFEHVAASAEDFFRAGTKIAGDMGIGGVDQLILETAGNKCIIAPCGDLSLCILTTADAQLGLIRVVLRSIQKEVGT